MLEFCAAPRIAWFDEVGNFIRRFQLFEKTGENMFFQEWLYEKFV
jgi:hypothetical protein